MLDAYVSEYEVSPCERPIPAQWTEARLLDAVRAKVRRQHVVVAEHLVTVGAGNEWLCIVKPHVCVEITLLHELLSAALCFTGQFLSALMDKLLVKILTLFIWKRLVAVFAVEAIIVRVLEHVVA